MEATIGRIRGGLAIVATLASMFIAAIAVDYTLLIGWIIYRSLDFKKFYELVVGAGVTSALIMFIIGTAKIFRWGLAFYQIP